MQYDIDIAIIGAGTIGLAIASKLSGKNYEIMLLEKNERFGLETSSRNSGTIHTGILSPKGSLNDRLCLESNRLIYEFSDKNGVDYRKCGKILVAVEEPEIEALESLYENRKDEIEMELLSQKALRKLEPSINGQEAIFLAAAGVVDAYGLMRCNLGLTINNGGSIVYKIEVVGVEKLAEGYKITIRDSEGISNITSRIVINCAGLHSHEVAAKAGLNIDRAGYSITYFKGEYYSLGNGKDRLSNCRLIYPLLRSGQIVGIHNVLDIDGRVRLGPDFYPVKEIEYSINDSRKTIFYESAKRLFPFIDYEDIEPESAGIMPRLYGIDQKFKEYVIRDEQDKGLPGFINLLGIESPGLTCSPAIAEYVYKLVKDIG
jgi:L-2-hydroxyglutarate oxidase LhgO